MQVTSISAFILLTSPHINELQPAAVPLQPMNIYRLDYEAKFIRNTESN